jgi:hypothetical protein
MLANGVPIELGTRAFELLLLVSKDLDLICETIAHIFEVSGHS